MRGGYSVTTKHASFSIYVTYLYINLQFSLVIVKSLDVHTIIYILMYTTCILIYGGIKYVGIKKQRLFW